MSGKVRGQTCGGDVAGTRKLRLRLGPVILIEVRARRGRARLEACEAGDPDFTGQAPGRAVCDIAYHRGSAERAQVDAKLMIKRRGGVEAAFELRLAGVSA